MQKRLWPALAAGLMFLKAGAGATAPPGARPSSNQPDSTRMPLLMSLFLTQTKSGLFVRMPMIDTDPNRGFTYGFMPIWISIDSGTLRDIHAPAVSYNGYVGVTGQYEYFRFPSANANLHLWASASEKYDRSLEADYEDRAFLGRDLAFSVRGEYARDSTSRFYGIGQSPRSGESDYTFDTLNSRLSLSVPLRPESPWRAQVMHRFQANKVLPGAVPQIQDFGTAYPVLDADLSRRHRDAYLEASLAYDTRDNDMTTSRGTLAEAFFDGADKDVMGQYSYHRYGARLKQFWPFFAKEDPEPRFITATRVDFENLDGSAPFWAQASMGGKYFNRAYGEGRFVDRGLMLFSLEQRCRIASLQVAKTPASFWIDPFVDLGTVFPGPEQMQANNFRPGYGVALRAVGRPRIVGSADFGYGQEGLKVFLDINYSF